MPQPGLRGEQLKSFLDLELVLQNNIFRNEAINPNTHGFNFLETEMASKAREKNAQGGIASEFCDPQACGKEGRAISLLPMVPEPSPTPPGLGGGGGLWGNRVLTHCLAPGVEKERAHFQGDGRGHRTRLSCGLSLGKKGHKQRNETDKSTGSWGSFSAESSLPSRFP